MNSSWMKRFKAKPSMSKVMCTVLRTGKVCFLWISLNSDKLSTFTIASWDWLSWKLEFLESGQKRREPFTCPRPHIRLKILAGSSYRTHCIVWILILSDFYLFPLMKDGVYIDKILLKMIAKEKKILFMKFNHSTFSVVFNLLSKYTIIK